VYVFRAPDDRPLYVGTSGDIATRVRSYFTAAETRARMSEMLAAADRVEAIECAHKLEAEVRELRLIAVHKPPYNRRSKFPERITWLKLTAEAYPRLSLVTRLRDDGGAYLGPFSSRRTAELAMAGVHDVLPLRQCTPRLSPRRATPACALAEMGRCPAPCELRVSVEEYGALAGRFRGAVTGDPAPVLDGLLDRIDTLAARQRYEDAAAVRSRLVAFGRAAVRMQRLAALTRIREVAAARRTPAGGWELAVVRHGRLAAAGAAPPGVHPVPVLDALLATAETVRPGPGPTPCASAEETERVLSWLERPDTRLVSITPADPISTDNGVETVTIGEGWAMPVAGAARWRDLIAKAEAAPAAADPLREARSGRTLHRPPRANL